MFEKLFRIKTFSVPFTTVSTSDKKKRNWVNVAYNYNAKRNQVQIICNLSIHVGVWMHVCVYLWIYSETSE